MDKPRQPVSCATNGSRKIPRAGAYASPGFSLVELLVVVTVMVILTTLYWNHGMGGNRRLKACEQNLLKIHLAMEIYANDFGGRFPALTNARTSGEVLSLLVPRYTSDTATFICPASKDSSLPAGEPFRERKISYAYYMGLRPGAAGEALMSDRQIDTLPKSMGERVFSETGKPPGNNHDKSGGNFLFCDGRVEASPARVPFSLAPASGVVLLNPQPDTP